MVSERELAWVRSGAMCLATCIPGFSLESSFRPLSSWPLVLTKLRPRNCSGRACRSVQPLVVERRSTGPAVAGHLVVARLAVVRAGRRLGRSLEALCLACLCRRLFCGQGITLDRWSGTIAKHIVKRPSALHSTFHFWRKSRRIASSLMLPSWTIEEVSPNNFVFDVVEFKSWGSLAELLRFWCCQVQKWRKCPRIALFSNLKIDRSLDR